MKPIQPESNYTISGVSQLLSVPYALYAKTAGNGFSGNYSDLQNKPSIPDTLKKLKLDAGNNTINNVANPVKDLDAVNKAYVDALLAKIQELQIQLGVDDIDGNHYKAVKIGNQVWMAENLKTTHYRNGDSIPNVTSQTAWDTLTKGAYCDYDNIPNNGKIYGKIYNFYTLVDSRNVCPTGWHVATEAEFTTLQTYLGGANVAGGKMKEVGTLHWVNPNLEATNESGFTALGGGGRSGGFVSFNLNGMWWIATEASATTAWWCLVYSYDAKFNLSNSAPKSTGLSVRCVKD